MKRTHAIAKVFAATSAELQARRGNRTDTELVQASSGQLSIGAAQ